MPSLADAPEIIGFFSYSREDDRDSEGGLSTLRRRIQNELRGQLGRSENTLRLWQDAEAIPPGTLWESQIGNAIEHSVFFIPIISPRVINSQYCQIEFQRFLAREKELRRADLVFPIIYIEVPQLKSEMRWRNHPALNVIGVRQWVDWSDFRFDLKNPDVGRAIAAFCRTIVAALDREIPDPAAEEEVVRKREVERIAQERAEENRRQKDAEREARIRDANKYRGEKHELGQGKLQSEPGQARKLENYSKYAETSSKTIDVSSLATRRILGSIVLLQGLLWEVGLIQVGALNRELMLSYVPFVVIMAVGLSLIVIKATWVIKQTLAVALMALVITGWLTIIVINLHRKEAIIMNTSVITGLIVSAILVAWSAVAITSLRTR